MKRYFLLILTLLYSYCSLAQEAFIVSVVDKTNNQPIPHVSLVLLKSNLAATTDENGKFELNNALSAAEDTLLISVFGYHNAKFATSYFSNSKSVELKPVSAPTEGFKISRQGRKRHLLNEFQPGLITYFLGLQKSSELFNYLQVAQKFELPVKNASLKQVTIFRLIWEDIETYFEDGLDKEEFSDTGSLQKTKFRVRIYDVDSITGLPGRDLTREVINVNNRLSKVIKMNLASSKVTIPHKTFFVAVEWLRIPYNLSRTGVYLDQKLLGMPGGYGRFPTACYKPILGMSHKKSSTLNTYSLTYQNQWVPYTHFAPELTDFAISAEVEY